MINLIPINEVENGEEILYRLLEERTPEQSISHKKMPTMAEHKAFIASDPYLTWCFIKGEDGIVGSIYLTRQREIGISIFKGFRGYGYGKRAVKILMMRFPGKLLANINPFNLASIGFFQSLDFKHIQNTYESK